MTLTSDQFPNRRRSRLLTLFFGGFALALVGLAAWRVTTMVRTMTRYNELLEAISGELNLLASNGLQLGDEFLNNVREGRLDAAYAATSTTFRERMGRADFEKFVADHPFLKKPLSEAGWSNHSGFNARVEYGLWQDTITSDRVKWVHKRRAGPGGGARPAVELVFVVEDSSVKVEQCTVESGNGGKP